MFADSPMGSSLGLAAVNVQGEVRKAYNNYLRQAVLEHIQEKGEVPRNRLELLEKAESAARKRLEYIKRNAPMLMKEGFSKFSEESPQSQDTGQQQPNVGGSPFDEDGNLILPNGQKIQVRENR